MTMTDERYAELRKDEEKLQEKIYEFIRDQVKENNSLKLKHGFFLSSKNKRRLCYKNKNGVLSFSNMELNRGVYYITGMTCKDYGYWKYCTHMNMDNAFNYALLEDPKGMDRADYATFANSAWTVYADVIKTWTADQAMEILAAGLEKL